MPVTPVNPLAMPPDGANVGPIASARVLVMDFDSLRAGLLGVGQRSARQDGYARRLVRRK